MSVSLIIPSYAGGESILRTVESVKNVCDDVVIISTAVFDEDKAQFKSIGTVVELPWNYVFLNGFGNLHNCGSSACKNDWMLLLGVGETFAESFCENIPSKLASISQQTVLRCNHVGDPHTWKRVWNRTSTNAWSGIIHEEITGGTDGGLLFRMQDTPKQPSNNAIRNAVIHYIKAISYNLMYFKLQNDNSLLGGSHPAWIKFVTQSKVSIYKFVSEHQDMIGACISGDLKRFVDLVSRKTLDKESLAVNFNPTGQTGNEHGHTITDNECGIRPD